MIDLLKSLSIALAILVLAYLFDDQILAAYDVVRDWAHD